MKNIPFVWTIGMIVTTPFWAYLLLPLFISAMLTPPGTKSASYGEELKSPKTPQHYLDRGLFALDKPTNKQVVKKALADCQTAEKLAREKKDWRSSDAVLCQSLAHAFLGNGVLARKLVAQGTNERRRRGSTKLADLGEADYTRWIKQIEAKPPLPEEPSPYGLY